MRLLPLWLLLVSVASAAELKISRVTPCFREAASFERISSYFGSASDGPNLLCTQSDNKTGYYFLTRVKSASTAPIEATVELNVITADAPEPKRYTFPNTKLTRGGNLVYVGVTGQDWPSSKANPVAWQLRLLDSSGQLLAQEKSFLWSQDKP